jgi:hypothetical protein
VRHVFGAATASWTRVFKPALTNAVSLSTAETVATETWARLATS